MGLERVLFLGSISIYSVLFWLEGVLLIALIWFAWSRWLRKGEKENQNEETLPNDSA